MAEPPAKRARRVDSSAMWDKNDHPRQTDSGSEAPSRRSPAPRDDRRDGPREDRRYRSRSRERNNTRRERSWSPDSRDRNRRDKDRDGRGPSNRKRSTSRDRGYERRGHPSKGGNYRDHSRSRSPARNGANNRPGTRSPPPRGPRDDRRPGRRDPRARDDGKHANGSRPSDEMDIDFKEDADEDEMEDMMRKAMGFTRFRTTKNTKVPGNQIYGVRKEKMIVARQYMNRSGGFNRPLSPGR